VLSRSPYWSSILGEPKHPLNRPLRSALSTLYSDPVLFHDWLTGRRTSADVVKLLGVETPRYPAETLLRYLERDCARMTVNVDVLRVLRSVRDRAFVVVASDNVDVFAQTFRRLAARRRPDPLAAAPAPDSLAAWSTSFDDLVCSAETGVVKASDARAFFGRYLWSTGLRFSDALLVDDRTDNCAAFREAGGATLRWTMHADRLDVLAGSLEAWLEMG